MHITVVIGTRPEAIKMAPVVLALKATSGEAEALTVRLCATGQHGDLLRDALDMFDLQEDENLNIMRPGQDLTDVTTNAMRALRAPLADWRTDLVLVHGDTTTALSASLAAYYQQIPVGHVEAGLRSGNKFSPWPEEVNRRIVGTIADLHFAPTNEARSNLLREGVAPHLVSVTGNTVIDALHLALGKIERDQELRGRLNEAFEFLDPRKHLVLVTAHRRENFGAGIVNICAALRALSLREDVEIVYPVHPNPNIVGPVRQHLSGIAGIHLVPPADYLQFAYLMSRSRFLLTDSGGLQEEAPSLGKPVLVMRDTTERPEAIAAGTARLVGTDSSEIVLQATRLLDDPNAYRRMATATNPFGDGRAALRIVEAIRSWRSRTKAN